MTTSNGHHSGNGAPFPSDKPLVRVDEFFGADVFTERVMQQRLPKDVSRKLLRTIAHGDRLDHEVADVVAAAMKVWPVSGWNQCV